jgi:Transposase DDE domain
MRARRDSNPPRSLRKVVRAEEITFRTSPGDRDTSEQTIAWLSRGARRLRYRGVTKNDAWLKLRASGINLRQLCTTG